MERSMIPALLLIAFHVIGSPPVIFEDDFSSCEFDSNWIIFEDPAPEIVDSLDSVRVLLGNRSSEWGLALHNNITVSVP